MFGSPVVISKDDWIKARSVVSGRFVNGYATNDWILGMRLPFVCTSLINLLITP